MKFNETASLHKEHWEKQQNYDLYRIGTFVVLFLSMISLIAMYFLCPFRWHRKLVNETLIKIKKGKKRKFFDTRSISANTEFDFEGMVDGGLQQQLTPTRPHPSILKLDPKHTLNVTTENMNSGGAQRTLTQMNSKKTTVMENGAGFIMNTKEEINSNKRMENNIPASYNRKATSFGTLPAKLSSSRGQLKDRRPSVVTFDLDSKRKENRYNTTTSTEKSLSRRGLGLNLPRNKQMQYFCDIQNEPILTKRYSSSQDLVSAQQQEGRIGVDLIKQRRYSTCASIPDFQRRGLVMDNGGSDMLMKNSPLDNYVYNEKVCDDDIDEGQMQCFFEYDSLRNLLTIKELQIKASFPAGVPGFVVEISLEPKLEGSDVARSKVYVTVQQQVEIRLDEQFTLSCDNMTAEQSTIIITVVPILGNLILYVETELKELNLIENGEIFLGGFFKGVHISKTL